MSTPDTITEVTYHHRPANDAEVNAFLRAIGFEGGAKHLTDVLAGRRPSALAEPSVWRDKAKTSTPPAVKVVEPGMRVRCWNISLGMWQSGEVIAHGSDGRVHVRRDSDGHTCRFRPGHVEAEGGGR